MGKYQEKFKKVLALLLTFVMVVSVMTVAPGETVNAASPKYVKSLKVSKSKLTLTSGGKGTVNATVKVQGSASKKVKVTLSKADKDVVGVKVGKPNKKGVSKLTITAKSVTAKKTAKVKVVTSGKNKKNKTISKTVKVTVNPKQPEKPEKPEKPTDPTTDQKVVTSIKLDKETYTVERGKSVQAKVIFTPDNASDKTVKFSSSNEKVATVTDAGIIFGFAAGTATITATTGNGKKAEATVTVTEPIVITLSATELTIGKNQTATITASIADVTWSSDNLAVATVDQNGKVTGISAGVANIVATSGTVSASCKVTVTQYDPENDGVTLSVFNPIKNNKDANGNAEIIENTVLVNQDMIVQAYVQKDATPKKGSRVKLVLDKIDNNVVKASDYVIKVDGVTTDTAVTNDEGIAEFTVTYNGEIPSTYYVDDINDAVAVGKCPYISFNASTLVDNQPNNDDITVKFASVVRQGIQVDNNRSILYDDIIPFDGHAAGDTGIQTSYNTNDYYPVEYVTSQQVGNNVYMSAIPYFILPPERKATEAKFEVVFPSKEVTSGQDDVTVTGSGATESYTIYNDGADITTTTSIINVPEGLVSMSVFFNKISISKYSKLYIDLYEYDGKKGKNIYSKTYTEFEQEYSKEDGVQIENVNTMKGKGILIVSIQSPGQVDVSTTGYSLNKVTGDFNSNDKAGAEKVEVINAVKWADVTEDARYAVAEEMTYDEIAKYLKEYVGVENSYLTNDSNYTFACRIPVFNSKAETANAITGNALLTATYKSVDGTVKTATYAYPVIRATKGGVTTNINELMPKTNDIKAIFLGYDVIDEYGNIKQTTGGMTQNGNQAVIKSASSNVSGAIFVEARLQIDALEKEISIYDKNKNYDEHPIRGANSKYPMYSYVQFVAKPDEKPVDGKVPTFHAIEDQYIVVTGEVIAENGEVQTNEPVEFYVGDEKIAEAGKKIGTNVQVKYLDTKTNKDGKAYLVLVGQEGAYVQNLSLKYEGNFKTFNTYAGNQKFEAIKQGDKTKNICDLCWLDLGLAYEKDATALNTWIYSSSSEKTENTASESVVDKTWKVGFLPTAECPLGSFTADFAKLEETKRDTSIIPRKLFVDITNVGVAYGFDGINYENCKIDEKDGAALITSSKTGETKVYGDPKLNSDTCKVTYYDSEGNLQTFETVGVNECAVNTSTFGENIVLGGQICYTMNWTPDSWESEFTYPYGNKVYKEQDTKVYYRLHDKNGNAIVDKNVTVTATFNDVNYTKFTATTMTDKDGLIIINIPAPSQTGELVFTVEIAGGVLKKVSTPINYVDKESTVEPLKIKGEPAFDKDNTKKITLTYNNQIVGDVLTPEMLKKLFVVKDKNDNVLEIENVTVNITTVVITLSKDTFIENEKYSVEVMTGEEVQINGIVYVMYDTNGQAMLKSNAKTEFTVGY